MSFSAFVAPLVSGIGEPMARGLLELATILAAVALSSVMRSTDAEPRETSPATEDEDLGLAHPSRRDGRKLDSGFRVNNSTRVLLPIHQLYMRGPGAYLGPSFVFPAARDLHERLEPRDFSNLYGSGPCTSGTAGGTILIETSTARALAR